MADVLYFNGRFTTTDERVLSVEDRGFLFGDGVYEVFKFLRRRPVFLDGHFRRMQAGLAAIEIPLPWDEQSFRAMVEELVGKTAFDDGIVYVQVSRGEGERAHAWKDNLPPTAIAYSRRFNFPDEGRKTRGIGVITTRDIRWQSCHVKSVNLLANVLAKKRAAREGADEALLLADGMVREGAASNFFAIKDGHIVTHPLDEHILPGVVRDHVIEIALRARIRVDERPLREKELGDLDEAFITSTTQGVMPVVSIDRRPVGNGERGSVTARLQAAIDELEMREVS